MSLDIHQFDDSKYINLETYKKNGKVVNTPVWFVIEDKKFFVITRSGTGKVKRLRHNPNVRISPCNFRGKLKGKWVNGTASLQDSLEYERIMNLRNKKYGFQSKLASLFTVGKGKYILISIKII
jgi:PPOX class probable F420-dependent enzyme